MTETIVVLIVVVVVTFIASMISLVKRRGL
jgi:hypothetical protein